MTSIRDNRRPWRDGAREPLLASEGGFTLVELAVSMLIMMVVTAAVFGLVNPSQGSFRAQPEVSDMQQRLRVAASTLEGELMMAGAGTYSGGVAGGALLNILAPIMPRRVGGDEPDAPEEFREDAVTIMYVQTAAQTTIEDAMPLQSNELKVVESRPGCPEDKSSNKDHPCGFQAGQRAVVFDDTGSFDVFTITHVQNSDHLQHKGPLSKQYQKDAQIAALTTNTYYLKVDDATSTYQLRHYDGIALDEPMVDNVVALAFEYFAEPHGPVLLKPVDDSGGPFTSYGPTPPAADVDAIAGDEYQAGENCIFDKNAAGQIVPRLSDLSPGKETLIKLTVADLTLGPWCPNGISPQRFDADLLRVRQVGVRLRVQVESATLRGPAGVLFSKGGYSKGGVTWVPDQEVHFTVSPRNLNLGR